MLCLNCLATNEVICTYLFITNNHTVPKLAKHLKVPDYWRMKIFFAMYKKLFGHINHHQLINNI